MNTGHRAAAHDRGGDDRRGCAHNRRTALETRASTNAYELSPDVLARGWGNHASLPGGGALYLEVT